MFGVPNKRVLKQRYKKNVCAGPDSWSVHVMICATLAIMAWVIVGLGNPGAEYQNTRHNTGRLAVERFAALAKIVDWKDDKKSQAIIARGTAKKDPVVLVLPETFMNKSGNAVAKFVKSQKAAEKLIVVYDDLDLGVGAMKLSFDRGSGGHKGLESIIRAVKTKAFARIRIGVSPATAGGKVKKPHGEKEVNEFILGKFKPAEMKELDVMFDRASDAINAIIERGPVIAMNEFNQK